MNLCQKYFSAGALALLTQAAFAQGAPTLGTASSFGALGGTGVTCTVPNPALPAITVTGDVGSGTVVSSVTGFVPFGGTGGALCSLSGAVRLNLNGTAPINDMITAYNALRDNNTCPSAIASHNLVGSLVSGSQGATLEPGVYCISGVGLLTSKLTLAGGPNDVWIFKADSSLTPKNGSVVMAGGNACNVYWQVNTAVDLLNTAFVGNVLAGTSITFTGEGPPGTASSLAGRALAQTLVTMTGASINNSCAAQPPVPPVACKDKDKKDKKDHEGKKHQEGKKHGEDRQAQKGRDGHDRDDDDHDDDDCDRSDDHNNPFGKHGDDGKKRD